MSVFRHMHILWIAALFSATAASAAGPETAARYEAAFADGRRVVGAKLSGWGRHPATVKLDGSALTDPRRPMRWIRDRRMKTWTPGRMDRYIEFVGGDRIVGHIEGALPAARTDGVHIPAHLMVKPAYRTTHRMRIVPDRIRRVVFRAAEHRKLQPGTLFGIDGGRIRFVQLRWTGQFAVLLLKTGTRKIDISDIAEVHLPQIDPWEACFRELAVLSPSCKSRIMRIETKDGLIATCSSLRFSAEAYESPRHRQAALGHLERLNKSVATVEAQRKANQQKSDQARVKYRKQINDLKKQAESTRQAHLKRIAEIKKQFDTRQKADAADWRKKLDQLDRKIREADDAMKKHKSKDPKRDNTLKSLRNNHENLRKSRDKLSRENNSQLKSRRRREYDRLIQSEEQKLQRLAQDLQRSVEQVERKVADIARQEKSLADRLTAIRLQRDAASGPEGDVRTWVHIVQPVWSLDPLWIPFRNIRTAWSFAPEEVPLCRIPPSSEINPPLFPGRTNANLTGRPLRSGGRQFAWGFAVHAYSELRFELPRFARAFSSSIGLDASAGVGGCARARVHLGSVGARDAYESPLLIGSRKIVDSGRVSLAFKEDQPPSLILQADPVGRDAPPRADPLNIRDKLNWLDPIVELDKTALQARLVRHIGPLLTGRPEWRVRAARPVDWTWTGVLTDSPTPGVKRFSTLIAPGDTTLRVSRKMKIGPKDKLLAVYVNAVGRRKSIDRAITLKIDGGEIKARKAPVRQVWRRNEAPLLFPLDQYEGREVTLELAQAPGGQPLAWKTIETLETPPAAYRLSDIMKLVGRSDMKVPYELGQALQSARITNSQKLLALDINRRGGRVRFQMLGRPRGGAYELSEILLGAQWAGGDRAFIDAFDTFGKIEGLKTLVASKDSGVSDAAIAKLRSRMPKLEISRTIKRIPSHRNGAWIPVTWRNLTGREVAIIYVGPDMKLRFSRFLNPGQVVRVTSNEGSRIEAHYRRKEFTSPEQYAASLPLTTCNSRRGIVWDIRPVGQ